MRGKVELFLCNLGGLCYPKLSLEKFEGTKESTGAKIGDGLESI